MSMARYTVGSNVQLGASPGWIDVGAVSDLHHQYEAGGLVEPDEDSIIAAAGAAVVNCCTAERSHSESGRARSSSSGSLVQPLQLRPS
jgi:hypothetical protein